MTKDGRVFGCISGACLLASEYSMDCWRHNKKMIDELPEEMDYKNNVLIVLDMFSVPMRNTRAHFWRYQMIHFGFSIKHLDDIHDEWIQEFENLLRKLYWHETHVYMNSIREFEFTEYSWKADIQPLLEKPPQTIKDWKFKGGMHYAQ
ncbi:MAG: hypothetical protein AAF787_19165 [Chloroflexota bacterium]